MEESLEEVYACKYHVAKRWIRLLQHGFTIRDYLNKKGITSVIIYGFSDFEQIILEEYRLADRMSEIKAISDKKIAGDTAYRCLDIRCVAPNKIIEYCDDETIVIVTPMGWHRDIIKYLDKQGIKNKVTIQELICDMNSDMF